MRMRWKPLIAGLAVFVIAATTVGAIVGPPVPVDTWTVQAPHIGDHGLYTVAMFNHDGVVMEERPYLRFTWEEPAIDYEFDGTAHWTNRLHVEQAFRGSYGDGPMQWITQSRTHSLDAGTNAVIASNRTEVAEPGTGPNGVVRMQSSSEHLGVERQDRNFQCGLLGPLQGKTFDVRKMRIHEDCHIPFGVVWTPDWFEYVPVAVEDVGGEALRFHGGHPVDDFVVDYWFTELPYPVKIATTLPNGTTVVTSLREFHRGDRPLTTVDDAPPLIDLQPLELSPMRPWGPDDAGIEHPFKASEAWAFARNAPEWSGLRDALAQNPELRAYSGSFWEHRTVGETTEIEYSWQFSIADPPLAFIVRDMPHEPERGPLGEMPEVDPPERDRVVEELDDEHLQNAPTPPTGAVELPTVASLWRDWEVLRGARYADMPANSWGWNVWGEPGGIDARVRGGVDVSIRTLGDNPDTLARLQGATDGKDSSEHLRSTVSIDNPGSTIYQRRDVHESWYGRGPAIVPPEPQSRAQIQPMAIEISPWNVPALPWWIGSGVLATLVAGIVWTWPILKASGMGLFSRHTRSEQLLEDPTRQRMMDVIAENPGIHLRALATEMGTSNSAALHHTRKLTSFRLIRTRREGQYTAFYPAGVATTAAPPRSAGAKALLEALEVGPMDIKAAAAAAGISVSTAYHHVGRLVESGHIVKDGGLIRRA